LCCTAPRLSGRLESPASAPVAIMSERLAKAAWFGESAIGKCVTVAQQDAPCRMVIGVVAEARVRRIIEEPAMELYLPSRQEMTFPGSAMVIRAVPRRVRAVAAEARRLFVQTYGGDGSRLVQTMAEVVAPEIRPWRLGAALFSAAGLCALVLAAVGVYSSVAYAVSERTHEMSVRAALGAKPRAVMQLVVGEGIRAVVGGVFVGVAATLALGKLVASMLLGGHTPRPPGAGGGVAGSCDDGRRSVPRAGLAGDAGQPDGGVADRVNGRTPISEPERIAAGRAPGRGIVGSVSSGIVRHFGS